MGRLLSRLFLGDNDLRARLFQRGDTRELEPSDAMMVDVTGDKKDDLVILWNKDRR